MRSLSPPAASSALVAPLPTTRLSNSPGLRTAANNSARVPTSGPTACMRSIPKCCASLITNSPIVGRHHVGTAFGSAEARQVDHDHRAKRLDRRQDPAEGVDAFRPRAGQEDGDAVGATAAAARKTNLQAVYLCCRDMADIRKAGAHRMLLEVTLAKGAFVREHWLARAKGAGMAEAIARAAAWSMIRFWRIMLPLAQGRCAPGAIAVRSP
jgi:hypothetical protein